MKNPVLLLTVCCLFSLTGRGQEQKEIKLNTPDKERGVTVMKAFEQRKSDREFANKELSLQDLSDLLWAANGVNRPESGKRTAPSAMNRQDVDIYVCRADGAFLYDAMNSVLKPVSSADLRPFVADAQAWAATAPVCLVLVSDISKFGGEGQRQMMTGAIDAGIVSQNIAIFCAGTGLVTIPRMSMNQEKLRSGLKLKDSQQLFLNNPVGYAK